MRWAVSDVQRFWVLPLQLRIHQITNGHRGVVFASDYDALATDVAALRADAERQDALVTALATKLEAARSDEKRWQSHAVHAAKLLWSWRNGYLPSADSEEKV